MNFKQITLKKMAMTLVSISLLGGLTAYGDGCNVRVGVAPGYDSGYGYRCHTVYRYGRYRRVCNYGDRMLSPAFDSEKVKYISARDMSVEDFAEQYSLPIGAADRVLGALKNAEKGQTSDLTRFGLNREVFRDMKKGELPSDSVMTSLAEELGVETDVVTNMISRLMELNDLK